MTLRSIKRGKIIGEVLDRSLIRYFEALFGKLGHNFIITLSVWVSVAVVSSQVDTRAINFNIDRLSTTLGLVHVTYRFVHVQRLTLCVCQHDSWEAQLS